MSPGVPSSSWTRCCQSFNALPPAAVTVACADRLKRRPRSSLSKPFITEITVIRASTPKATPSKDTQVMKETKKLCSRARE